ncbi:MAG: hypothetical protein A3G47_00600 [Candidatus Zambryskibacteria bacterium RIFCSPLOWO2_12_FULL_39_45]|uniref:Transglycosylase SLT domain-containing protein n=3 Tax=Candidatus Zambryskiibacteriota TaxID=1817925 RepID=A0A1G2T7A7_9BACT|nr:MAG: hypothetical protein UT81_C0013G0025 [Parcubacteria group bacterium GW2011_GWA2_40_14]OHA92908.1 MAG: hypothetical protein A2W58_00120 [Candidatus Zambryskibacteria bacterium RIFCSPHIGHO2_02_38_10.5]OHA96208.1 MAG: hypothetical protein A3C63_02655 [Candidatus Zambryskibacteria bacterium RIFCSPHIGHO2_02_FULL_39_82]OHA98417.1 MAG: hypothetical protein A3E32_01875 [Candidatus Zambryskibacteria bacterium RIFCSPHIGHO2_12_FULL_38_37]OHB09185.1 MAG: hypothetical protein A2W64_01440 [Candidatus
MFISSVTGVANTMPINEIPTNSIDTAVVKQVENRKSPKEIESILSTEQYVREYFKDIPIMIAIARCESTFRQLDHDGDIHRGRANSADVGVMQINEFYHLKTSEKKDYDIHTIEGNTAYARELYKKEGTKPWTASKPCWGKYEAKSLALALNAK